MYGGISVKKYPETKAGAKNISIEMDETNY